MIANDAFLTSIHDEPDIVLYTFLFDEGFISGKDVGRLVIVGIYEWFYHSGGYHGIVGYSGVRYLDIVNIPHGLSDLSGRHLTVHMVGQNETENVRVELLKVERSCSLRQGVQIHGKEVHSKFSVEIVQLIMVFFFFRETFWKFLSARQVIRALLVDALVDTEDGTFFYNREDMTTMRAFDGNHLRLI